jgi:hypothetical protein
MDGVQQLVEALVAQALVDYQAGADDAAQFLQEAGLLGPEGLSERGQHLIGARHDR